MFKLVMSLLLSCLTPVTHIANVSQADNLLKVSVIIRAKEYTVNEETFKTEYHMIGCSGTYIGPTTVLTAAHCFEWAQTGIWVRGPGEKSRPAVLVKVDPKVDLALLSIQGPLNHTYASVAKRAFVGEGVAVVGSPLIFEFLFSEGVVAFLDFQTKKFKAHYLIHTAMINSGSSGGGVFNDKNELLGVNTMTVGCPFGWSGVSMAVDSETIRKFLK